MITLNKSIRTEQNYAIQILTALLFILILKIFTNKLLMMLKDGLISNYDENDERPLPIAMNKKVKGLFKDGLRGKIMKVFVGVKSKT